MGETSIIHSAFRLKIKWDPTLRQPELLTKAVSRRVTLTARISGPTFSPSVSDPDRVDFERISEMKKIRRRAPDLIYPLTQITCLSSAAISTRSL